MTKSEQARADAMADAETLITFLRDETARGSSSSVRNSVNSKDKDLRAAWFAIHHYGINYNSAFRAADHAFRAVPGLRGE